VRLRIDLAYDGGGFRGFARQSDQRTVQGVLEAALARLVRVPVSTTGAGRTDAGVHALAQVVTCDVPGDWPYLADLPRARRALDRLCGPDLTVWDVAVAGDGFDARFSARARRYRYRLCDTEAMAPLWRHDTWHAGPPRLDPGPMTAAGAHLVGEHDFSAFCRRAGDQHLVRRVLRVEALRAAPGLVTVEVDGRALCRQMVRSIVAALLPVGRGRRDPAHVAAVLAARDRAAVGAIAPPQGLTLVAVDY